MDSQKYLYDKVNRREVRYYFQNNYGEFFVDADPNGVDMSGKIHIVPITHYPTQYEVRIREILEK